MLHYLVSVTSPHSLLTKAFCLCWGKKRFGALEPPQKHKHPTSLGAVAYPGGGFGCSNTPPSSELINYVDPVISGKWSEQQSGIRDYCADPAGTRIVRA